MQLITMAHSGEAQGVIETFNLKRINQETFQGEDLVLLITGEGPFEAATRTALAISQFGITRIINIGIAGSLSSDFKIGDMVNIRTVYLLNGDTPAFKTFQAAQTGVDCLTSFERILDRTKAEKYKGLAHVVDREAWGVAMAAKTANVTFECYKVISDDAGSIEACELVREKASFFSELISKKLSEVLKRPQVNKEVLPIIKGFHFTFSTGHKFNSLLSKISIKEEKTHEEVLELLKLQDLTDLEILPKERTRLLLEKMETVIDPVKGMIQKVTQDLSRSFASEEIRIQFDTTWEKPSVTVSFEVSSDTELKEKAQSLNKLSLAPFQKLMHGEFNVE